MKKIHVLLSTLLAAAFTGARLAAQDPAPAAPAQPAPSPASAENPAAPKTEMQKWIETTDAQWQAAFKRDVADWQEAELNKAKVQYISALEDGIKKASTAGDLKGALALRDEQKRFADTQLFPEQDDAADPAAVKQIRAAIRVQIAKANTERATRAQALHAKYDAALAQTQVQLTKAQRLDDALLVQAKRDEVKGAWLAGLPATSPAPPEPKPAAPVIAPAPEKPKALAEFLPGTKWDFAGSGGLLEFRKDGSVNFRPWTLRTEWKVTGANSVAFLMHDQAKVWTANVTFTDDRSSFSGTQFRGGVIGRSPRADGDNASAPGTPTASKVPAQEVSIKDLRKGLVGTVWIAVPPKPLRGGLAATLSFTDKSVQPGDYDFKITSHNSLFITFTHGDKQVMTLAQDGKHLKFTAGKTNYVYELASK